MTESNQPVRVLQCPKCGAGVEAAGSGAMVPCGYCGATLQVTTGKSGNLIARMSSIDDSTAFVARTEALKRARLQLTEIESHIDRLRQRVGESKTAIQASKDKGKARLIVGSIIVSIGIYSLGDEMNWALASLLIIGTILVTIGGVNIIQRLREKSWLELDIKEWVQEIDAWEEKREPLKQQVERLEAGLDELSRRL